MASNVITVETVVAAPVEKVWRFFTEPEHIVNWNNASPDWHTPHAENYVRVGGNFKYTMAARDGSMSFDFGGTYTEMVPHEQIKYIIGDGRIVEVLFTNNGDSTIVIENFEPETTNPIEMQQFGWQAILDSFKAYTEAK